MIIEQSRILAPEIRRCLVSAVHDGDTFSIVMPKWPAIVREIPVRIQGIDAPELDDPRPDIAAIAARAHAMLTEWIGGRRVMLREVRRDKYFRLISRVQTEYVHDVGDVMLAEGLVRSYLGEGPKPW